MSSSRAEDAALALARAGRPADAESALRALIAADPANVRALHTLGFVLATSGRLDEGLELLDRSLAAAPANAAFLDNRGQVLMQAGRAAEARRDFERAVGLDSRVLPAWLHLSQAHRRLGDRPAALQAIGAALAIDAGHVAARYHEALLHLEGGDFASAEQGLRRVLQSEPRHVSALNNLGVVLRETGRAGEAMASFQRAAASDPGNVEVLNNLALALHQDGQSRDAIRLFKRALQLRPGFAQALVNWGNALRDGGDLAGARARYGEALAAEPGFVPALVNHASALLESEQLSEARASYEKAVAAQPGNADALAGLAQVELREQRFAIGWDHYELRFATHPPSAQDRALPIPRLTPANLGAARRVAVWMEQGVGDQILFSTLLPEFAQRGVEAIVEVDPRLVGLYRRRMPGITFVAPAQAEAAFARCDFHVPLGSLPRLFRRDASDFARQPSAILAADAQRVESYRAQLGGKPTIAIAWRSLHKGNRQALGDRKSVPLEEFAALAQATGARLLDLQYGDVSQDRAAFEARHPGVLVRLAGLDPFADLEGLAAALVACGRLVSSSNVTAHLAGALGVPTALLSLRAWAPFFYWVPGPGGRSLWYPSVQVPAEPWESWPAAFEAIAKRGE